MRFITLQRPESGGRVLVINKGVSPNKIMLALPENPTILPDPTGESVLFAFNGRVILTLLTENIAFTHAEPDAEVPFSGDTNDLITLLQEQFFYKCCSNPTEMAQYWKATGNTIEPTTPTNTVKVANTGFNVEPVLLLNNRPNNTGNTPQVAIEIDALPTGAPNMGKYQKFVADFNLKKWDTLTIFKLPMSGLAAYGDLKIMTLQEGTAGYSNWQYTFSAETAGMQFLVEARNNQNTFGGMDITYNFLPSELHINITNNSGADTNSTVCLDLLIKSMVA